MMDSTRRLQLLRNVEVGATVLVVLLATAFLGAHASVLWIALFVAAAGAAILLLRPILGLFVLVAVALMVPLQFGTGTEVSINLAVLVPPALVAVWALDRVRRHEPLVIPPSTVNIPLWLFVLGGLFSLVIGNALWDPAVPRSNNLTLVQLAQWAVFAFSAVAFWLTGSLVNREAWLYRLTFFYLVVAGLQAILRVLPGTEDIRSLVTTLATNRAPFWLLLAALAGGQLLFNHALSTRQRRFLLIVLGVVFYYTFVLERKTLSNMAGVVPVLAMLAWLRWPRWRRAYILLAVLVLLIYFPALYQFAGGEAEWEESGGSRLALAGRVVEVSMRNPITGIGPAAYRAYARMKPLLYGRAYYLAPAVNSHNNYVDLFSQLGIVGLMLFFWFSVRVIRLGWRLRTRFTEGFAAGYVNAMLAAWVGSLVVMAFADWILPYVYNIGFPGFQASVLVWMFLGGLVALDQMSGRELDIEEADATRT